MEPGLKVQLAAAANQTLCRFGIRSYSFSRTRIVVQGTFSAVGFILLSKLGKRVLNKLSIWSSLPLWTITTVVPVNGSQGGRLQGTAFMELAGLRAMMTLPGCCSTGMLSTA